MCDEERGHVEPASQRGQLAAEDSAQRSVERGERLVEQQQRWFGGERARERHALLLPAGHLAGPAILEALESEE